MHVNGVEVTPKYILHMCYRNCTSMKGMLWLLRVMRRVQ